MTEHAKRKPTFSLYSVKKRPRGEKHPKEDYKNICSVWLDEKYDATIRPECSAKDLFAIWDEALKGQYGSVTIKVRGINRAATSGMETGHYAKQATQIINQLSANTLDDDVPF